MLHRNSFLVCRIGLAVSLLVASLISIACPDPSLAQSEESVAFDFSDIDIRSFVKVVSELTGQNYVLDPAVSGKITVTSPKTIPREAIQSVFDAVLDVYGFTAISEGNIVKIIPSARARQESAVETGATGQPDDGFVTQVLSLQRVDAEEIRAIIQPLLTRAGHVAVHIPSRTVIVADSLRNVHRIEAIVAMLDSAGHDMSFRVICLDYADASKIAEALNGLYNAARPSASERPVFIAESRSNCLLTSASNEIHTTVMTLIQDLDKPLQGNRSAIRVYHLTYSDAVKVAAALSAQVSQIASDSSTDQTDTPKPERKADKSPVLISPEPGTNALIVTASPEEHQAIGQVIADLDRPRRQILVEGLIVEMSSDRMRELGLEWRLTDALSDSEYRGLGGTNLPLDGSTGALQETAANPLSAPPGLALGLAKGTISYGGVEFINLAALARAMEGQSGVNILSTPHLLTLDNEEAEIIVGEERPFLKSSQTTDTGAVVKTYEFKDIGLTMRILPRITGESAITLRIFQEIRDFVAESDLGAVTSTKRQAKTVVRVADGQIAAIGGLLKESRIDRRSQVPCLGAIPGLGYLFRSSRDSRTKTNLLIFITPHLIDDDSDLATVSDRYRRTISPPKADDSFTSPAEIPSTDSPPDAPR